jgi:hypothetical protein
MKNIGIILFVAIVFCGCQNDVPEEIDQQLKSKLPSTLVNNPRSLDSKDSVEINSMGRLVFDDTIHDFGTLVEGEKVECEFAFMNKGKKEIIINEARASCGCTVAEYPKLPIKPGGKDIIKVTFNSQGKEGFNKKVVAVTTNGNPSIYEISIQADVKSK